MINHVTLFNHPSTSRRMLTDSQQQQRQNHHGGWCHSHPLSLSPTPGRFTQTTTNHNQATVHNHAQRSFPSSVAKIVNTSLLPWDKRDQIRLDSWWLPSWFPRRTWREAMSGFWPVELSRISPEEVRWGSSTGVKTGRPASRHLLRIYCPFH